MGKVYALMAGIERYCDSSVSRLYGCRADIADAKAALSARLPDEADLRLRELYDDDATRDAVIDGFRTHLARATSDDAAVFWFSGHGSFAQVPRELWHLEPNGRTMQTLVCADSRVDGRADLLDKELGLLLDEVADRGCHILVVLDSCHSGGATRGGDVRVRAAKPSIVDTTEYLLPDLVARYASLPAGAPRQRHVTLSACRSFETAMEQPLDGVPRGVFSWALSRALRRATAEATYRDLLALTRTEMECLSALQRPQLSPDGRGLGDQPIFGGPPRTAGPALTVRWGGDGWRVDAGAVHGVAPGTRLTVSDRSVSREVRLTVVQAGHSLAEPIGWQPDPNRIYPVMLSAAALAAVTVAVDHDALTALSVNLAESLSSSSVTMTGDAGAELTIGTDDSGLRLADRGGTPIRHWPAGTGAVPIVRDVEHIARWRQVWQLSNPRSGLRDLVSIELVEPLPGEKIAPPGRDPVVPDADGAIRLADRRRCFIRLRNRGPRPLFCVLLTLTDTFAVSAGLVTGATVAAHCVAAAAEGAPVEFSHARAWLKLIVTDDDFEAAPYELPPIGEVWRDLRGGAGLPANEWWTTSVQLIVRGPRENVRPHER
jgi:hypothetical protein